MRPSNLYLNFEMKNLGKASFVFCIEIQRDGSLGVLDLSQRADIHLVHIRFNMHSCLPGEAPIVIRR